MRTIHPTFTMKDLYTLCVEYQYNPVQALLEIVTAKYSEGDLSQPNRFTTEQQVALLNNDLYKYPLSVRLGIHNLLVAYFDPKVLVSGLQAMSTAEREAQQQHFRWDRLSVEDRRTLITLMERMAVDAEPGYSAPGGSASHDERALAVVPTGRRGPGRPRGSTNGSSKAKFGGG
jgi:hypothetical protein